MIVTIVSTYMIGVCVYHHGLSVVTVTIVVVIIVETEAQVPPSAAGASYHQGEQYSRSPCMV